MKKLLLIPLTLLLTSCPDLKNPHFKDGEAKLMTDEKGIRYTVTHVIGDQYKVVPLDPLVTPVPASPPSPTVPTQPTQPTTPPIDPKWR